MEAKCCICGTEGNELTDWFSCDFHDCNAHPTYCFVCARNHWIEMRCPKHFLKAHREDVARHSKGNNK